MNPHPHSIPPVLVFENVLLEADALTVSAMCDVSFELPAGGLLLVLLDREHLHLPLADAASGLIAPSQGTVRFNGRDWREMGVDEAASHRGTIGRIFDEEAWVTSLHLDENLILSQRHHTGRRTADLRREAMDLSRRFRLPGVPLGKPRQHRRQDLQKAACVRAFMGRPRLILLERPTRDVHADIIFALANAVYEARRNGAAVVWTTEDRSVWDNEGLMPSRRARVLGARLYLNEIHEESISIPAC